MFKENLDFMSTLKKIKVSGVTYDLGGGSEGNKVIEVTQAEYDALASGESFDSSALYVITDADEFNPNIYVKKSENVATLNMRLKTKSDAILKDEDEYTSLFYLTNGTLGYYCVLRYSYRWNTNYGGTYSISFTWGNDFKISSYVTMSATYDSETNTYTVQATNIGDGNVGGLYGLFTYSEFIIEVPIIQVSGQTANVVTDGVSEALGNLYSKTNFSLKQVSAAPLENGFIRIIGLTNNGFYKTYDSAFYDNDSIIYKNEALSVCNAKSEIFQGENLLTPDDADRWISYDTYNMKHSFESFAIYINQNYSITSSSHLTFMILNSSTYDSSGYNGYNVLNLWYRYNNGNIEFGFGSTDSNMTSDYETLRASIKDNYHIDLEISNKEIKYTKSEKNYYSNKYYAIYSISSSKSLSTKDTTLITNNITKFSSAVDGKSAIQNGQTAYDHLGGLKLLKITQSDYDALEAKDSNTLYIITS